MSRTEQLRLLFSSLLDTFMLLLLFVYTWNGVAILVLQNFERISALKPSVETEKMPDWMVLLFPLEYDLARRI